MILIAEGTFILERFPGKGGWTYIRLPDELITTGKAFGMMKISGSIDHYSFEGKHLMPMGDGTVFLPVAKPIRKNIGKEKGDEVTIQFFREDTPKKPPQELIDCLNDYPRKLELFYKLSSQDQLFWIEYIYSVTDLDSRSERIIKLLDFLKG